MEDTYLEVLDMLADACRPLGKALHHDGSLLMGGLSALDGLGVATDLFGTTDQSHSRIGILLAEELGEEGGIIHHRAQELETLLEALASVCQVGDADAGFLQLLLDILGEEAPLGEGG